MPHDGTRCTDATVRDLADTVTAPGDALPARLSALLEPFAAHDGLVMLVADATGGWLRGTGRADFVDGHSVLDLDELRRGVAPGTVKRATLPGHGQVLQVSANNGALLLLSTPGVDAVVEAGDDGIVLHLWNIVAQRAQDLADTASPSYLQLARVASSDRFSALADLTGEYTTTLEAVLAVLRSKRLDDAAARSHAMEVAAGGVVKLRTATDRARTFTEEPVTSAFARLRDDLRPLVRYRGVDVDFVEPPREGRPLPSEVAYGARAVVRSAILALIEDEDVARVRVQWDCDGTNLLIHMRDDGAGGLATGSTELDPVRTRIVALGGSVSASSTPGWGTELSLTIPLDPAATRRRATPMEWGLSAREAEVLDLLASGLSNRGIAQSLSISPNTVKFHLASVFRKMGVSGRAAALAAYLAVVKG
ncbi:hypothetical protein HH308_22720 [Gordonia sp. TBRC 11910]|uniref:HTH luxR-type domain-containing protein n=1 Tax=Gordonia asplenii TaxID=2725283 RepID=A0A848L0N3_9ACTN|nr:LuxR C-terminal-related transcriptional regulator [Gordonia asplenii]NMO04032.1 hypothetical protein [Gordonia asplenii]